MSLAQGLIIVTSTVYGRTDRVTCSTNRPNSQVSTTTCSSAVSSIAKRYTFTCNIFKIVYRHYVFCMINLI